MPDILDALIELAISVLAVMWVAWGAQLWVEFYNRFIDGGF